MGEDHEGERGVAERVADLMHLMGDAYLLTTSRRLVLVRHGEARHVTKGDRYDPGLSPRGKTQAVQVATRIAMWASARDMALFTSPRRRAVETAQSIAVQTDVAPEADPGLTEVGGDGVPVAHRLPDTNGGVARFCWDVPERPFRGTATAGVDAVLARSGAELVVVVTHGGVINAYVARLLGLDCDFFFHAGHTSLTVARMMGNRVALDRLNDTGHLELR